MVLALTRLKQPPLLIATSSMVINLDKRMQNDLISPHIPRKHPKYYPSHLMIQSTNRSNLTLDQKGRLNALYCSYQLPFFSHGFIISSNADRRDFWIKRSCHSCQHTGRLNDSFPFMNWRSTPTYLLRRSFPSPEYTPSKLIPATLLSHFGRSTAEGIREDVIISKITTLMIRISWYSARLSRLCHILS